MQTYNLTQLIRMLPEKSDAVRFLQCHGILHTVRRCRKGHDMVLSLSDPRDRWRCNLRECREEIPLRKDTWLDNTKLS